MKKSSRQSNQPNGSKWQNYQAQRATSATPLNEKQKYNGQYQTYQNNGNNKQVDRKNNVAPQTPKDGKEPYIE